MTSRTTRTAGFALAAGLLLTACSSSASSAAGSTGASASGSPTSLSLTQRVQTAQVCVAVGGAVATAGGVAVKVVSGGLPLAQAKAQLAPVEAKIGAQATAHPTLPIAADLHQLQAAITALSGLSTSSSASDLTAAATSLKTATSGLAHSCAAVA